MSELELRAYPLPYTLPEPPAELVLRVETGEVCSDTADFDTRLDTRDVFFGMRRCVICAHSIATLTPARMAQWFVPYVIELTRDYMPCF